MNNERDTIKSIKQGRLGGGRRKARGTSAISYITYITICHFIQANVGFTILMLIPTFASAIHVGL